MVSQNKTQREIKFRAWHPEEKLMFIDVGTDGYGGIVLDTENMGLKYLKGKAILMQFTGLHDKNNKEIYEGDIVESQNFLSSVMVFQDGSFLFGDITYTDAQSIYPNNEWEVIGNIYEEMV